MKTTMKLWALAALLTLIQTDRAWATSDPTNNQDSIQITITPLVDRGVDIDSATVAVNLGAVALQATTQTVRPATVTVLGTLNGQELDVAGVLGPTWSFDTTPTTGLSSMEENALAFYLLFSDTALSAAPSAGEFAADNGDFTGTTLRAGGSAGNGTKFEKTGGGALNMDNKNPTEKAHMWFFLRTPGTTTTGAAQTATITLTAVDAS